MTAKICPECHCVIVAPALACRACMDRKARSAAMMAQAAYFPAVLSGRLELHIRRRFWNAANGHIALFSFQHQAYCGEPLATGYPHRSSEPYDDELLASLCEKCVKNLQALMAAQQKRTREAAG